MTACELVDEGGGVVDGTGSPWLELDEVGDRSVLRRARGPVLDVGCGPGRHLLALRDLGVDALGIDVTPVAVAAARRRGALVLQRSVFADVPGARTWRTALLLDGNVGIGGRPAVLLRRLHALLGEDGRVLAELGPPGTGAPVRRVRVTHDDGAGPWFAWAVLASDRIDPVARAGGFHVRDRWEAGGRWFAELARR